MHAAGRDGLLDHTEHLVEAHAEIGILPAHARLVHHGSKKTEILSELIVRHRLVVDRRVNAERARIRTTEARDHRHELEHLRLFERGRDELPPLLCPGQLLRLTGGAHLRAHGPVLRSLPDHVPHGLVIGEAEHIVEEARGIFGIAARVRSAKHGDCPARTEQSTDGVRELRVFSERADKQHVDVPWQHIGEDLGAGIADVMDVVSILLAPDGDCLGHDAGKVGIHDSGPERGGRGARNKVQNSYAKSTHGASVPTTTDVGRGDVRVWVATVGAGARGILRQCVLGESNSTPPRSIAYSSVPYDTFAGGTPSSHPALASRSRWDRRATPLHLRRSPAGPYCTMSCAPTLAMSRCTSTLSGSSFGHSRTSSGTNAPAIEAIPPCLITCPVGLS